MSNGNSNEGLSPFRIVKALRQRWVFFLIPVFLVTAGAAFYSSRLPVIYQAQALIASRPDVQGGYLKDRPETAGSVQDQIQQVRAILFSPAILNAAARELKLFGADQNQDVEKVVEAMRSRISIQVDTPDSFYLRFEGDDPEQAMRAANRLADLFVARASDVRGKNVEEAASLLDAEIEKARKSLESKDARLNADRQQSAQHLPEQLAMNLKTLDDLRQRVRNAGDKITEEQARRSAIQTEMKELEKLGALGAAPVRRATPTATEVALENLKIKLQELRARYTPENPEISRTEQEIRDLEASYPSNQGGHGTDEPSPTRLRYLNLKAELEAAGERLSGYQKERSAAMSEAQAYQARVSAAPQRERALAEEIKDADFTRSQYESLLAKRQSLSLDERLEKSASNSRFQVLERAQVPTAPAGPPPKRILLAAFAASLGFGFLLVLAVEQMDTTFDTVEEFQAFSNLPVWSAIPNISSRMSAVPAALQSSYQGSALLLGAGSGPDDVFPGYGRVWKKRRIVTLVAPTSIASEQYGIFAMKVRQWMDQNQASILTVTSSAGGEGKSVSSVNLAVALSSCMEGPVLLVDGDLRRPRVHQYLGLKARAGFSELLAKGDGLDRYLHRIKDLTVIPGGPIPLNPVGLLTSRRAQEVLAELKRHFRLIVVDSPPIMPIVDSHVLANFSDGVLIVVRARATRRELFRRAVESLSTSNVLGVLLNDVEYRDSRYAYVYKYYQKHYMGSR